MSTLTPKSKEIVQSLERFPPISQEQSISVNIVEVSNWLRDETDRYYNSLMIPFIEVSQSSKEGILTDFEVCLFQAFSNKFSQDPYLMDLIVFAFAHRYKFLPRFEIEGSRIRAAD